MSRPPGAAGGFTLLEVLFAVALIATICVGVATLFLASSRAIEVAQTTTIASLLAREKMEELRALPLDDPAMVPPGVDTLREDVAGYSDVPAGGYKRRWLVASLPMYPALSVVLQVNVLRDDGAVVARVVTIRTRKAI